MMGEVTSRDFEELRRAQEKLEAHILYVIDVKDQAHREATEERFQRFDKILEMMATELKLQAREYERRLDELNNSHEKYNQDRNRFVDAESHSQVHQALGEKMDAKFEATESKVDGRIRPLAESQDHRIRPIEISLAKAEGKADQRSVDNLAKIAYGGLGIGAIGTVITIIQLLR